MHRGRVSSVITVPDSYRSPTSTSASDDPTYRADSEIQLRAPGGTTVLLIDDLDQRRQHNALFDDTAPGPPDRVSHAAPPPAIDHPWRPVLPLAAFRACPDRRLDLRCATTIPRHGTLMRWSLFVTTDTVVLDPPAQGPVPGRHRGARYHRDQRHHHPAVHPLLHRQRLDGLRSESTGSLDTGDRGRYVHPRVPAGAKSATDTVTVTAATP
jgi:hypothetical protein